MGLGQKVNNDGSMLGLPNKIWIIIAVVITWLLFVILFIFGILLIAGTLGNAHEEVIRFMNCDKPDSAVSCSRVYGYRAEGVVLVILSFFALGWALLFSVLLLLIIFKKLRSTPPPVQKGGLTFSSAHAHTAHFATSEA